MPERLKNKLLESTQWYKDRDKKNEGENETEEKIEGGFRPRIWKEWRRRSKRKNNKSNEENKEKGGVNEDLIEGVLFVQHTDKSELAKRIREKLSQFEDMSSIRLRVVERTGEKLVDILHKSNPWSGEKCGREDCRSCASKEKKL